MAKLLPDGPVDTFGLRDAMLAVPERLAEAAATGPVADLPAPGDIDHVVVVAPGAARTSAEIVRTLVAPVATVPVIVHADVDVPSYVAARSLVVVAAMDDDRFAVDAVATLTDSGARVVVVAPAGSELAALATHRDVALLASGADVPVARVAVGVLAAHLLALLEQLGHYGGAQTAVAAAVTQLERRRQGALGDGGAIARLARRIGRLMPIFYGADALTGVAARHAKRQVNLNAKAASFAGALPQIGWDEISGWGQHGDMTRQVFTLVTLRHDGEHPDVAPAMRVIEELLDEVVHERHELRAEGNGPFAQVLDLVFQADLLSWHLAQELEIDPGPTAALSAIWSRP